jgi:NAD(P)-dependent dehydrogenase (short-subunit alcohol dehydrogenase family)
MGAAMDSLPEGYRALVVGASGGLGAAFVAQLQADPRCAEVHALHRRSTPPLDFDDEAGIAAAAAAVGGPLHLVINAAGLLHTPDFMPEKKLGDLNAAQLMQTYRVNAVGPALLMRHFVPLLAPGRALVALLSAKVGSIGDNRLGGWYGYRASKAALNMLVRTAAIEGRRRQPGAVLVALHPGTVDTRLSRPFRGEQIGRPPEVAAAEMLGVLDGLSADDSGRFISYRGEALPW